MAMAKEKANFFMGLFQGSLPRDDVRFRQEVANGARRPEPTDTKKATLGRPFGAKRVGSLALEVPKEGK